MFSYFWKELNLKDKLYSICHSISLFLQKEKEERRVKEGKEKYSTSTFQIEEKERKVREGK